MILRFAASVPALRTVARRPLISFVCAGLLLISGAAQANITARTHTQIPAYLEPLPRPISLQPYVDFWVQIYGVYDDGKAVVHDSQRTDKVYEVVEVPHGKGQAAKRSATAPVIEAYRQALLDLAEGKAPSTQRHRRVLTLWGQDASQELLRAAADRLRFQPGHADEFKKSLVRAAKVQPYIRRALREANIPLELDALPHVESFFRNEETSSASAIGIWQFTPSIGREYMRVDALIDERLDPRKSAIAATQLLAHNLRITGNWPMAVTSYNHGTSGILRAARELKTPDIGRIARHYTGKNFGFASRNFYAAVLAAAEVEANAYRYFGPLPLPPPLELSAHHAPANSTLPGLAKALDMPLKELQQNNLALGTQLREGRQLLPSGYTVWLACGRCVSERRTLARLREQNPGSYRTVKIEPGDSLSVIAENHGFKTQELVQLNGLKSANHIRAGQELNLPWPSTGVEPQGEQLAIPEALMQPLQQALLSTEELTIQHRLRNPDPYKPDQRFGYRAQLALYQNTRNKGLASLKAEGTRYPAVSKYLVDSQSSVRLQPEETIDHLAQWLEISPQSLFLINELEPKAIQSVGQRVTVVFDSIGRAEFERRRKQYHLDKQRRFYAKQQITGDVYHEMKNGEKIWSLVTQRYGVPLWLLFEYNPSLDFRTLRQGDKIHLPKLEQRHNG
ncbi:MAG: transglycosylase SLT domain-containing protein [Granulosicoccaceae bacterium]